MTYCFSGCILATCLDNVDRPKCEPMCVNADRAMCCVSYLVEVVTSVKCVRWSKTGFTRFNGVR